MPARCAFCAAPTVADPLCAPCVRELPWRPPGRLSRSPRLEVHASFRYVFPLPEFIGRAKLGGDYGLAQQLGTLMATRMPVAAADIDLVCPVPLPYLRSVRRGYNQALEMARPIAAALSVPLVGSALVRHGQQMQRGLNREQRQRNVAQSFTADACVRGQRVLVIDDVTTTGASLREAARALRAAGATQVIAWAAAAVD